MRFSEIYLLDVVLHISQAYTLWHALEKDDSSFPNYALY